MSAAFDHIGLSVADLDAQLAWYASALDLTPAQPFDVPELGLRGAFLVGEGGVTLELLERAGSSHTAPSASPPSDLMHQGFRHLALRVADVDASFTKLVAAGASVVNEPGPSPEPGVRFAFVTDPEGNFLELLDRKGPVAA